MSTVQEDVAAENILKRAELARITRQLKKRLSQTNLKARLQKKNGTTYSSSPAASAVSGGGSSTRMNMSPAVMGHTLAAPTEIASSHQTNVLKTSPSKLNKKRSLESVVTDSSQTDIENDSPAKRPVYPPSSPIYNDEFLIPPVPKTPPAQKTTIEFNSASTNKTQIHISSPAQSKNTVSTPKRQSTRDEGADLLMFLATSPSPAQYKNLTSTPSRSIKNTRQVPTSQQKGVTPGTPKNRLKTPGFNLNDYLVFTPSPAITRTPGEMGKDVNGKLIKF